MRFGNLTDKQREIAIKIADEARANGVDPELALAVGWAENRFNPTGVSPKGAVGPMQVMPSNARGLGIDPKDLLDPDKNIKAGIAILKENLDRFGDPTAALVGYNANPRIAARFIEKQDMMMLPEETRNYLQKINALRGVETASPYGEPTPPPPESPVTGALRQLPEPYQMARRFVTGEGEIAPGEFQMLGGGAGAIIGTGERVYDLLNRRKATAATPSGGSAGERWAKATGYGAGAGETVREQSQAYQRAAGQGKITKELSKRYGPGAPLDITRQAEAAALEKELADRTSRSQMAAKTSKFLGKLPGGSIFSGAVAGKDVAEAMQRYEEGDTSGALINLVGGLGSAAMLVPHPMTRIAGGALSLASMPAEYINDLLKGKIKARPDEQAEYSAP